MLGGQSGRSSQPSVLINANGLLEFNMYSIIFALGATETERQPYRTSGWLCPL